MVGFILLKVQSAPKGQMGYKGDYDIIQAVQTFGYLNVTLQAFSFSLLAFPVRTGD